MRNARMRTAAHPALLRRRYIGGAAMIIGVSRQQYKAVTPNNIPYSDDVLVMMMVFRRCTIQTILSAAEETPGDRTWY